MGDYVAMVDNAGNIYGYTYDESAPNSPQQEAAIAANNALQAAVAEHQDISDQIDIQGPTPALLQAAQEASQRTNAAVLAYHNATTTTDPQVLAAAQNTAEEVILQSPESAGTDTMLVPEEETGNPLPLVLGLWALKSVLFS